MKTNNKTFNYSWRTLCPGAFAVEEYDCLCCCCGGAIFVCAFVRLQFALRDFCNERFLYGVHVRRGGQPVLTLHGVSVYTECEILCHLSFIDDVNANFL